MYRSAGTNGGLPGRHEAAQYAAMRALLLFFLLAISGSGRAAADESLTLPSGTTVVSQRHAADGPLLVLWLTGQYGQVAAEQQAAARLAEQGVETWLTDWFAPLFLPLLPSSVAAVPDADLADWLEAVRQRQPQRRIVFLAAGHAAAWPLRAVRAWRARYGTAGALEPVAGSVLLHPVLYRDLEPGAEPRYDPLAASVRLDTLLLQPMSSAGYWWRDSLKAVLETAGSQVWLEALPGVRDGFYRRADATAREQAEGVRLGDTLFNALHTFLDPNRP